MPDGKAGSWAAINGEEFVNSSRTIAYINNYGLPIQVSDACWCPSITGLLSDCGPLETNNPGSGYYLPPTDPAPWYDEAVPESVGFLGFLNTEFEGLGSTYTRNTFETLNGGAVLGRLRPQARTLTWRGYLFGTSCCAAEYGLKWLTARLAAAGGCEGCDGAELDILMCCPDIIECEDCEPESGNGPVADAFRTLFRVGLIDGPKVLSRREVGCGKGCSGEGPCGNCEGCLIEVEFSLVAGNPFLHREKELICSKNFPDCNNDEGTCAANSPWQKVVTTEYPASYEDGQNCIDALDCVVQSSFDCLTDPNCPTADLPTIPGFVDPCGCEPLFGTRLCCEISNDVYGQFFEGVPTVEVSAGTEAPLRNVIVSFYENPQERTCDDAAIFNSDCFKCASINIRYIPANTTITVDGITKRITAKCPGQDPQPAESLTTSPFIWPTLKCINYLVTVEADCSFPISYNAGATIYVTPREM